MFKRAERFATGEMFAGEEAAFDSCIAKFATGEMFAGEEAAFDSSLAKTTPMGRAIFEGFIDRLLFGTLLRRRLL